MAVTERAYQPGTEVRPQSCTFCAQACETCFARGGGVARGRISMVDSHWLASNSLRRALPRCDRNIHSNEFVQRPRLNQYKLKLKLPHPRFASHIGTGLGHSDYGGRTPHHHHTCSSPPTATKLPADPIQKCSHRSWCR